MSALFALVIALSFGQVPVPEKSPGPNWWDVHIWVDAQAQQRDLPTWAKQLSADPPPADAAQLMIRYDIFQRTGYEDALEPILDALAASQDPKLDVASHATAELLDDLIQRKQWESAKRFVERRPTVRSSSCDRLITHLAETMAFNELEAWLIEQARRNTTIPVDPFYHDALADNDYWFVSRLFLRQQHQLSNDALLTPLIDDIRKYPDQPWPVVRYLGVLWPAGQSNVDLDWLGDVCKPALAYDSAHLGFIFVDQNPKLAVIFLERSLTLPWTEADSQRITNQRDVPQAAMFGPSPWRVRFDTRQRLVEAYEKAGQKEKSKQLLEQIIAEEKNHPSPTAEADMAALTRLAGRTGNEPAVETNILESEAANKDNYKYWLMRANYHAGLQETAQAIAAYEKSLKLAKPLQPKNARPTKGNWPADEAIGRYASFYDQLHQPDDALALLWRELDAADPDSSYARHIIGLLCWRDTAERPILSPDDARLWRYLEGHRQWEQYDEQRLLERLLARTEKNPAQRQALWTRAEKAASPDADPTRSRTLGILLTSDKQFNRAMPLLTDAIRRLPNDYLGNDARRAAQECLYRIYLETGDWRNAEQLGPAIERSQRNWSRPLAVMAATAGAKADAMRLWQIRCKLQPTDIDQLEPMLKAGMRAELLAYYRPLSTDNPGSAGFKRIVAQLEREP